VDDIVAIARRAVADAEKGNARAREWVSRHLLGGMSIKVRPATDAIDKDSWAFLRAVCQGMSPVPGGQ
jgi:hypothetical protein